MATRRDLLEAEAHGRRRLAAAATAGTGGTGGTGGTAGSAGPGGAAPDEDRRPLRAVVVGVVLALLLLAAAAVVGVLRTPADADAAPVHSPRVSAPATDD